MCLSLVSESTYTEMPSLALHGWVWAKGLMITMTAESVGMDLY